VILTDPISRMLDLAIAIQQIPAPTFHEAARADFVRLCFLGEGLSDVEMDAAGNVYARLPGLGHGKPLVVSAHLDTVFPASVDLHVERQPESHAGTGTPARILGPGIGDNSLGVAALAGLVWALRQRGLTLPGDLWLVANTGEEGLGNLLGMQALVERFGSSPIAYCILEALALGQVYHRGLGVLRYRISAHTSGGHSWIDFGQPSAIHELTALSTRIATLEPPTTPRTTLNIGIISGGSSVNTIAAQAMLELDLRSESTSALKALDRQVQLLVQQAHKPGVRMETEIIGQRPSGGLPAEHALVRLAQDCLRAVGIQPHLNSGSTDANLPLSRGLPAVAIGLTTGGKAHTVNEYINIPPLEKGIEQVLRLVSGVWGRMN
jgi:tripeptide aminopeptidase